MNRRSSTDMDIIRERRRMLSERLDAIRNAALGGDQEYLAEITDDKGRIDAAKLDGMIAKMLGALEEYLASEKRELSKEQRQMYEDFLYCLLAGASPITTKYLSLRGVSCCTPDEEDPMETASWDPQPNVRYQDLTETMHKALTCGTVESLLLQELGDDDPVLGLKWGSPEYTSFFRFMSLSVFWLTGERTYLPDEAGMRALPEAVCEEWKQSYWNLLQPERNPVNVWLKRDSDVDIAEQLQIGPQSAANTLKGLEERILWSGAADEASYLKQNGFLDRDSYMEYHTARIAGQDKNLSREEVIALADRCVNARAKSKARQGKLSLEKMLGDEYTDEMIRRREFKNFEDLLYARALEWLGRAEDAATLRGCSAEEAEWLDMAAEVAEHKPTEEELEEAEEWEAFYEEYGKEFDENLAADNFDALVDAENSGIAEMEKAMSIWKERLPEAVQKKLVASYKRFRLLYSAHMKERAEMRENMEWMMEVYLYEKGISAASTKEGYGFVLYQLDRTPALVERQMKKARTLA